MKFEPTDSHPSAPAPQWGFLIHEVARLLKRRFEDEARNHGLTLPQWRTLSTIAKGGKISQAALAAGLDTDPMTMSGILDRLEKRDLIVRAADPNDSRAKLATITAQGEAVVEKTRDVGRGLLDEALRGVSDRDRDALVRALGCIRDNLQGETARVKELQS